MELSTEMSAGGQAVEGLEWSFAGHCSEVADDQSPWTGILAEHDSVENWMAFCRKRRAADTETPLARSILSLMRDAAGKPRGTVREPDRRRILADPQVSAFWASVVDGGDNAWREEKERIVRRGKEGAGNADRTAADWDSTTVRSLLPTYRAFGQMLIDAGVVPDSATVFKTPD